MQVDAIERGKDAPAICLEGVSDAIFATETKERVKTVPKDNLRNISTNDNTSSGSNSPALTPSLLLMNTARLRATSIETAPPGFFKRLDKDRDKSSQISGNSPIIPSDDGGDSDNNEAISNNSTVSADLDEITDSSTNSMQSQEHSKKLSLHKASPSKKLSVKGRRDWGNGNDDDHDTTKNKEQSRVRTFTESESGKWNSGCDRSDDTQSTGTATDLQHDIHMCPAEELLNYTPTE